LIPIDQEIEQLIAFLSHPAGFVVGLSGILEICPGDEESPPTYWAVSWSEEDGGTVYDFAKSFVSLQEAATFFVEKRHYMCVGLDFQAVYLTKEEEKHD